MNDNWRESKVRDNGPGLAQRLDTNVSVPFYYVIASPQSGVCGNEVGGAANLSTSVLRNN